MSAIFPGTGRARARMRQGALIGLMLLSAAGAPAAAQVAAAEPAGLGRVFFTPEQRQELDRRRQFNIREAVVTPQASTYTLSGQVSRSSGKTTTWVNSVPQHDAYRPGDPATAPVVTGENEPGVPIKVGQTLEKTSGNVTDGLAGGQVKVNRGARKRP